MLHIQERIEKIITLLKSYATQETVSVEKMEICPCDYKENNHIPTEGWHPFYSVQHWGNGKDEHAWFRFSVEIPERWNGGLVELKIKTNNLGWDDFNPQILCFVNGRIRQGIDGNHQTVVIDPAVDKEIVLYAYTGYQLYIYMHYDGAHKMLMQPSFHLIDEETRGLYFDMSVPFSILSYTDSESREYSQTLQVLNECVNLLDLRVPHSEAYKDSVLNARAYLKKNYYEKNKLLDKPLVTCIGQTHIDTAYMWPMRLTREKVQCSFATVLELMKRYPEYQFLASQPKQYQMLKEEAPELYEKVKERIAEGRWEAEGAMWVEADCNLISGESLVRQILKGKQFFKEEFGVENRVLWLPDVFGYSAALPQIMKLSGIDTFVTSKISWNDTNRMPYDLFQWKGIDGTTVLSYFITCQEKTTLPTVTYSAYNGPANAPYAAGTYARFSQKELTDNVMMLYGYGDGGGGPTYEFLENIRRMEAGVLNCPTAKIGSVGKYFEELHKKVDNDRRLPIWSGELYLEYHRGTYTSMAKNKRNNRKSEMGCRSNELLSVIAEHLTNVPYPARQFDNIWEMILTNQFHDIIPGTSVEEVYQVTDKEYKQIFDELEDIGKQSIESIASKVNTTGGYFVFNPNGERPYDVIEDQGQYVTIQDIPATGYGICQPARSGRSLFGELHHLENDWFKIDFNDKFQIQSLFDKRCGREVLQHGLVGNRLVAYEDLPLKYDAWELRDYHKEKAYEIDQVEDVEYRECGDRIELIVKRLFEKSTITQTIAIYRDIARVDFETEADWNTEHVAVKAEFPVSIYSTKATYEIQYGAVERPATCNHSWEAAQFEVCAQKYADYSEYGYGVALLNDCKYGHDIHDGVIRLTLLKCATYPNPNADKGKHRFTYSLMPHIGDYREAGVVQEAYCLNAPMYCMQLDAQTGDLADRFTLVRSSTPSVIVDSVKKAEDGNGFIVRCYEAFGQQIEAELFWGIEVKRASVCNLLEQETEEVYLERNCIKYRFHPYEIVTFRIEV